MYELCENHNDNTTHSREERAETEHLGGDNCLNWLPLAYLIGLWQLHRRFTSNVIFSGGKKGKTNLLANSAANYSDLNCGVARD